MLRLIRGSTCHWAIGPQFIARIPSACVGQDGALTPEAAAALARRSDWPPDRADTYHVTVLVTTRCNLACAYCFQNAELPSASQPGAPVRIPALTIDGDRTASILRFTRRQMAVRGATALDVMLFGGEPTMYLDYCLALLDGFRDLGMVRAAMISNGTLLPSSAASALAAAGLRSVQITFDGDLAAHDRSRVTIGGRGTFEQIVGNLAEASAQTDLLWQLRVNITAASVDGIEALVDRLAGRLDTTKFALYFALVHEAGIGFMDTVHHSAALGERVGRAYLRAMDAGFVVPAPRLEHCITCGGIGGTTGSVINSDGKLYSCWESAGKDGFEVGNIMDGYLPNDIVASRWVACGYSSKDKLDEVAEKVYRDKVDAIILDRLYAHGRLGPDTTQHTAWTKTA